MLYYLLFPLRDWISGFNVFRYITFRSAWAALTALAISLILGPWLIRQLSRIKAGQFIRAEGPESHQAKSGTPTMGGILIILAIVIPTVLWADIQNPFIWIILFVTLGYAAVGFYDDFQKIVKRQNLGLTSKQKLGAQVVIGLIAALAMAYLPQMKNHYDPVLTFPFFADVALPLGIFYIPFFIFVLVGASNAVNLTDGLDGLAIGSVLIAAGTYTILTYVAGHAQVAAYLRIEFVPYAAELSVFCGAMLGASLGFLWFNAHPAKVFMGDVGSLALGGAIGCLALMIKQEILLVLVGGLFVIEALSVIVQVISFKLTGRRVLKMSPLHHHFELSGWNETQVVVRFWIIAIIFALLSLSTLKLR